MMATGKAELQMDRDDADRHLARRARKIALVIAATMLLWMAVQWLGGQMGWPVRLVFVFDLAAIAALLWALLESYQIWRLRRKNQG